MGTYLDRYLGGDHGAVWAELRALGPAVRAEPVAADARAVARETMRRARINVTRLVARLARIGYRFEHAPLGRWIPNRAVHVPPPPDVARRLAGLEAAAGPLPLALRAWYEVVGEVVLLGRHPAWDARGYPDPLVVEGLTGWESEFEAWRDQQAHGAETEPFVLPVAPDYYHKQNVSGGGPYGVALPCAAADAPLEGMWHEVTFVDYLRLAFQWGGMPGWQRLDLGQRAGISLPETARPTAHLTYLSADLIPL